MDKKINNHQDVITLKSQMFDLVSYQDYLRTQFAEAEKQKTEKLAELNSLIEKLKEDGYQ